MSGSHYDSYGAALHGLSTLTGQKTIKAACGKRVSFSSILPRGKCDCEGCRVAVKRQIADSLWMADQPFGSEETRANLRAAAHALAAQYAILAAIDKDTKE